MSAENSNLIAKIQLRINFAVETGLRVMKEDQEYICLPTLILFEIKNARNVVHESKMALQLQKRCIKIIIVHSIGIGTVHLVHIVLNFLEMQNISRMNVDMFHV